MILQLFYIINQIICQRSETSFGLIYKNILCNNLARYKLTTVTKLGFPQNFDSKMYPQRKEEATLT